MAARRCSSVPQQICKVSRSTEELAQGSEHMVSAVQGVEKVALEVVASSQTLSSTTEEQTASTEEIAVSLDEMGEARSEGRGTLQAVGSHRTVYKIQGALASFVCRPRRFLGVLWAKENQRL